MVAIAGSLGTTDGTTAQGGGALSLDGKATLARGSAIRAEVGASNDAIGFARLAAGSTLKFTAPVHVDVDTDPPRLARPRPSRRRLI